MRPLHNPIWDQIRAFCAGFESIANRLCSSVDGRFAKNRTDFETIEFGPQSGLSSGLNLMLRILTVFCLFAPFNLLNAAQNLFSPNLMVQFTLPPMGDKNAFSLLGEFGTKELRGSGTYGAYINTNNRISFTGELLLQNLNYHFLHENREKWMTQYAVGSSYQYLFLRELLQSIDLSASFSHSFKRDILSTSGHPGRVAGSDAVLSSLGATFNLWECGYFAVALSYDFVRYFRRFEQTKLGNGFGGIMNFTQYLPLGFSLYGEADFRRPFYYYSGIASWHRDFESFSLDLGAYVNYTNGRSSLPNALASGVQISFAFGPRKASSCRATANPHPDTFTGGCEQTAFCDLATWAAKPAIYMPMVLAIADQ